MGLVRVFCVFLVIEVSFANEVSLLNPCPLDDIECLRKSTEMFLEKTYTGIPAYDFKQIDPLVTPDIEVVPFDGLKLHYKNVNITGFKKQNICEFRLDKESGSVLLSLIVDVHYTADIAAEFPSIWKSFTGTTSTKSKAISTAVYGTTIETNDKGVKHFVVGPETLTCKVIALEDTFDPELENVMESDSDVQNILRENNFKEFRKDIACKLISKGYETVIHNIRASAKVLPTTAYFTNL